MPACSNLAPSPLIPSMQLPVCHAQFAKTMAPTYADNATTQQPSGSDNRSADASGDVQRCESTSDAPQGMCY